MGCRSHTLSSLIVVGRPVQLVNTWPLVSDALGMLYPDPEGFLPASSFDDKSGPLSPLIPSLIAQPLCKAAGFGEHIPGHVTSTSAGASLTASIDGGIASGHS